jgi:hypothetical protein
MMRHRITIVVVASVMACRAPASDDAAIGSRRAPDGVPSSITKASVPWPDSIGDFLAIASANSDAALLFRRDTTRLPGAMRVIGYDSISTAVTVRDLSALPCAARARLQVIGAPHGWSLALDAAAARPVLIDALEDLSHADSQRVVVRIQRALNTLPDSGDAMEYRGLPVVVRDAWVVQLPGAPVVVARAARLRNLEAASHEELRFVVLEHDEPTFVARVAGEEESVDSWELLAVVMVRSRPVLVVAREGTRTLQLELIARERAGWTSLWRSDAQVCAPPPAR